MIKEEIEKIVKKEKASRFRISFKEPKHKLETIVGSNINRRTFQYSGKGVLPTIIGNDDRMLDDNIYRNEFPICATAAISVRHQSGSPIYVNGGYAIGILHGGNGYSTFARQLDSDLTDWLDAHGYFD